MDNDTKRLLGKILGEIYRVQRLTDPAISCQLNKAKIFGLLNGIESVIDDVLDDIGFISSAKMKAVMDILEPIYNDPEKLSAFNGFYDIESKLFDKGVGRGDAIRIFTYLKANNQFLEIIEKMASVHSPVECHSFELGHGDF